MKTLPEIKSFIQSELEKVRQDEDYALSDEHHASEVNYLDALKEHFGYDHEDDQEGSEYCYKATAEEILKYYLAVILPRIESQHLTASAEHSFQGFAGIILQLKMIKKGKEVDIDQLIESMEGYRDRCKAVYNSVTQ